MQPYYSRNGTINIHDMTSLTSTQQPSDRWNSPACQIPHIQRIIPQDRIEPNTPKNRHIPRLYLSTIVKATGAQHKIYNIDISPLYISHPWLVERSTYQDHQRYQIPDAATVTWTWYSAEEREREMWGWRFQECGERRVRPTSACFIFSNGMVDWVISDILCMLFQFYIQISGHCCGGCFGRFC